MREVFLSLVASGMTRRRKQELSTRMQAIHSFQMITPVRRIAPPLWACHGTSASKKDVNGVMGTADYPAQRGAT